MVGGAGARPGVASWQPRVGHGELPGGPGNPSLSLVPVLVKLEP